MNKNRLLFITAAVLIVPPVIRRKADGMRRTVETLVAAAREEASLRRSTADAGAAASAAAEACAPAAEERDVSLRVVPPARPVRAGTDSDVLERILVPLIENACRFSRTAVQVEVGRDGTSVRYSVEDDGPGVAEDERERMRRC
jgi:signal transduction histidine kinase